MVYKKDHIKINWITQGIKVSNQKMRLLNTVKKYKNLPNDVLNYINRYQKIYRNVIKEAKRKENDRIFLNSQNKTRKLWQIVNKEIGKAAQVYHPTSLKKADEKTSNPQEMANLMNSYFIDSVEELRASNRNSHVNYTPVPCLNYQSKTMFWFPVTETEIEKVIKGLSGKPSAGVDGIPEYIVKKSLHFIKKPLVHIFNASMESGFFPEKMKMAKIRPLYKKRR